MHNKMRFEGFLQLLEYQAGVRPNAPALTQGDRSLTYAELLAAVRQQAEGLRGSQKTCMAVAADGSIDCVITVFAANAAGLAAVLLDHSLEDEQLAALVRHTDADMVFSRDEDLKEILSEALTDGVRNGLDRVLFFTSGTTQFSKAVVLTGKSLCSSAWNGSEMLPLHEGDTLLCLLPLSHVFGFVCGLLWGLSCGARVALSEGPRTYLSSFETYRPTAVSLVPALLSFLLQNDAFNPELETLLIGAGDCPQALIGAAKAAGLHVSFGYGLTETSSGIAISTGGDPYAMDVCPDDRITIAEDGEILIEAPTCIMQGYYKDPESTEAVLRDGVLYSGDLGFLDADGRLHVTGRKKEMLVLSDGTKIFLPEYEAVLADLLKHREFAVDVRNGRPVLLIHTDEDIETVRKTLRPAMDRLPRGQQITDIIPLKDPLPRTAAGKIKRWELRQKAGIQ